MNSFMKKIVYDTLGVLMLIGAVLFGWLPGPGGVPLLLGGLGMLSINHAWARKLLHAIKEKGTSLYDIFFPNNKWVHWIYDVIGLCILLGAAYIIRVETKSLIQTLAIAAVFVSAGLLLTNRRRLEKINRYIGKIRRK